MLFSRTILLQNNLGKYAIQIDSFKVSFHLHSHFISTHHFCEVPDKRTMLRGISPKLPEEV